MDEVDGMAGNEDRGGVAELINLIKITKVTHSHAIASGHSCGSGLIRIFFAGSGPLSPDPEIFFLY